jgi:hypothetical protein
MNEPEPVDEQQNSPEIRGGDRPADYIPELKVTAGLASAHGGVPDGSEEENEYEDGGDC